MKTIYHIISLTTWEQVKDKFPYTHPSLKSEGFIHCSTKAQIPIVLERFFKDENCLIVLEIGPDKLSSNLIFERVDGDNYPHIYGEINSEAIREIHLLKRIEGKFLINF